NAHPQSKNERFPRLNISRIEPLNPRSPQARSAGFQTCCVADFQIGRPALDTAAPWSLPFGASLVLGAWNLELLSKGFMVRTSVKPFISKAFGWMFHQI